MDLFKKSISFLMVLCIMLGILNGCKGGDKPNVNSNDAQNSINSDSSSDDTSSDDASSDDASSDDNSSVVVSGDGVITQSIKVNKVNMSSVSTTAKRKRATKSNTRLLVNHDNPLFMFHAVTFSGKTYGESIVATYNALPADIRAFAAMYADHGTNGEDINALLKSFEEILKYTDAANVPIFLQLENWNSEDTRQGFTYEQLSNLLKNHKSLKGFVHVELSCCQLLQKELDRIKTTVKACKDNNALFIWQEMEYNVCTNTVNRALEDRELYEILSDYSHNVIIQDKHNGQGRHFSVQSSAMGAWLSGVCDNWGSNVESWLWWEEGIGNYNDMGTVYRGFSDIMTLKYPPAMAGIDTICDIIGGANMYSSEEMHLYEPDDGKVLFSEGFWSVIYPLYKRILAGAVPEKDEVIKNIKVAYQFTSANDKYMSGIESELFMDLYGGPTGWYNKYKSYGTSKKWIPTTGRYYIIPSLVKYVDAATILPNADIIKNNNYKTKFGSTASTKREYFNSKYSQKYTGDATLYSLNGLTYILNNLENSTQNSTQSAQFTMQKNKMKTKISLKEHTYAILKENSTGFEMELTNLRLDTERVCDKKENKSNFMWDYLDGGKMDSEEDFRTTTITLSGLSKMPKVTVSGTNNATASIDYSSSKQMATITIVSNGTVTLTVNK